MTQAKLPDQNWQATPCTLFAGKKDKDGYGQAYCAAEKRVLRAHRLAYTRHHGMRYEDIAGLVVRHACDTPACINPLHLSLGTHADNTDDKVSRGRQARGSMIGLSVLTEADIPVIRSRMAEGWTIAQVSRSLGCSHTTVSRVHRGLTWRHI
ncbi:HNH endonuclease [Robbsia andropogonis]|uniref:HNH endonuclease n=1 Tax=Robbsia andropogonis TaxID=28092 RepID=UPI003D1D02AB